MNDRPDRRAKKKSKRRSPAGGGKPRQRRPGSRAPGRRDALAEAIPHLVEWFERQVRSRLAEGVDPPRDLTLDLRLPIRFSGRELESADLDRIRRALRKQVDDLCEEIELEAVGYHRGRAMCYWCRRSDCRHSEPPTSRSILTGYQPTGLPVWTDFATWAIDRRDERVDRLFEEVPRPLAIYRDGAELTHDLIDEFRAHQSVYALLAQVDGGFFRIYHQGDAISLAVSAQLVERRLPGGDSRYSLNFLARSPSPFEEIVQEGRNRRLFLWLTGLRRTVRRWDEALREERAKGKRPALDEVRARAKELLADAVSALEKILRQADRRTEHAHTRSRESSRPTAKAWVDARHAPDDCLLYDRQQDTFVVRGPKNRAHVFTREGAHVTSVVYSSNAIRDKLRTRRWTPLEATELEAFRSRLTDGSPADRAE